MSDNAHSHLAKNIVLTGVSRGLGEALTHGFIAAGHTVIGCARSTGAIYKLTGTYPDPHRFDAVDLADPGAVGHWADSVLDTHGAPDLLINNAALINRNAPLWEVPAEEFTSLINVNITAVFSTLKAFLPAMITKRGGVAVNLSSGWGRSVSPDMAPYCTTKWAIEGMTLALAADLPAGLAAVSLNPGIINTDMLQSCFGDQAAHYDNAGKWAQSAVPFILSLDASDNGKALTAP